MKRVLEYIGRTDIHIRADSAYRTRPSDRPIAEIAYSLAHMGGKGGIMRKANLKEMACVVDVMKK
jgi:hypothetical protein